MKNLLFILIIIAGFNLSASVFAQDNTETTNPPTDGAKPQPASVQTSGSTTVQSNVMCVRVGNPTTEKPSACSLPAANLTAVSGSGEFVHYCQNNNPAWPTSNGCTLGASGCGPTSLAMAMTTFNASCSGGTCDPAAVNKLMEAAGQRGPSCMSVVSGGALDSQWFKTAGMETAPPVGGAGTNGFDFAAAKNAIDRGYIIIASATNAPSCNCNHIFVIQDVDPISKTIHVRDPICKGNNQEADYDSLYNNSIRSGNLSWLYAVPVKGTVMQQGVQ